MENTKSKITLNLYGNKHKAEIYSSDPDLTELVQAFTALLESHDFELEEIHEAFASNIVSDIYEKESKLVDNSEFANEAFFDVATREFVKK